jgi:2-keto-4-pentenoate hydratase/2-oxohepta-3-ene-1,7-dioic acid hydratase in catechol pathway
MKLVTFTEGGHTRVGAIVGRDIVDAAGVSRIPSDMQAVLAVGRPALDAIAELVEGRARRIPLAEVALEAPVKPSKYLAVSLNYADHIIETGKETPEFPTFFNKQISCITGPGTAIHRPRVSRKLDYEGELAFVIGRRCRHVPKQRAQAVIGGYMAANDVSVRDWQIRSHTWTLGKSFDTHGPIGPWIVTPDEVGNPHALDVKTWVNDALRQSFNTQHMIFDCFDLVEYLSTVMTLEPGDIISTGTSSGVGVMMQPRGYLKPGDVVTVEIEKIGALTNRVVDEPAGTDRM